MADDEVLDVEFNSEETMNQLMELLHKDRAFSDVRHTYLGRKVYRLRGINMKQRIEKTGIPCKFL